MCIYQPSDLSNAFVLIQFCVSELILILVISTDLHLQVITPLKAPFLPT